MNDSCDRRNDSCDRLNDSCDRRNDSVDRLDDSVDRLDDSVDRRNDSCACCLDMPPIQCRSKLDNSVQAATRQPLFSRLIEMFGPSNSL